MVIHEKYKHWASYLAALPQDFEQTGKLLYKNGRNVIKSFFFNETEVVAKMYETKNIFQRLYYSLTRQSKAKTAYKNAIILQQCNVLTPAPIAYWEEHRCGILTKSCYVMEYVDWRPIVELMDSFTNDFVDNFVTLLAQMHKNGIVHHDMNCTNVLYQKDGDNYRLMVIDINRMERKKRLSFADYMDDLVRFTDNQEHFRTVVDKYASMMGYEKEKFIAKSLKFKEKHDKRWIRKKYIKNLLKL